MGPTRRSKSDRSYMQVGLEGTSSAMSRSALRYMDLPHLMRCFLTILPPRHPITLRHPFRQPQPRPALFTSSFRDRSNRSGGDPCHCPRTHYARSSRTSPAHRALVSFREVSPLWPYPRGSFNDREDIAELDFADTSALVGTVRSTQRGGMG
jgi:hypothetical protein